MKIGREEMVKAAFDVFLYVRIMRNGKRKT